MADQNSQNKGSSWDFQRSGRSSTKEEEQRPSGPMIPQWVFKYGKTFIGIATVFVAYIGLLLMTPSESEEPSYEVPGGDVQTLSTHQIRKWTLITTRLAERISEGAAPVLRADTLFSFYGEMKERKSLKKTARNAARTENTSLQSYRDITHEIALTYPFRKLDTLENKLEQLRSDADEAENRVSSIKTNRRRVQKLLDQVKQAWNQLSGARPENERSG